VQTRWKFTGNFVIEQANVKICFAGASLSLYAKFLPYSFQNKGRERGDRQTRTDKCVHSLMESLHFFNMQKVYIYLIL